MLLIGEPADKKADPQNVVDGQFSGPFVISAALATGAMGWDSYGLLQDPAVRALLPKVHRASSTRRSRPSSPPTCPASSRSGRAARTFAQKVVVPKGEPANFLTEAELRAKFAGLTDAVLGAERAARLADAVLAIDTTADVAKLMRLAAPLMPARLAGD